jgi:hypothetical protein
MPVLRTALVAALAFLAGYVLLVVIMLATVGVRPEPGTAGAAEASVTDAAFLASVQGLISAIVFGVLTSLARSWRLRPTRTQALVGVAAGLAGFLLSWTGLVVVGASARAFGLSFTGAGTAVMTWVLAAWPGFALGLVVIVGAMIVAPPRIDRA